ncbi:hypothetical protein [Vibrio fluvialis]|nr:hypothetical protein [Vibrio fluvialis]
MTIWNDYGYSVQLTTYLAIIVLQTFYDAFVPLTWTLMRSVSLFI